jgi:hypothetical protein
MIAQECKAPPELAREAEILQEFRAHIRLTARIYKKRKRAFDRARLRRVLGSMLSTWSAIRRAGFLR